ncbi:hypothetical protein EVJ58_g8782 [Rhodofomes roseus]|uniref:Major facilitator superfamily (MFS) profile domain-containing protein n=1 Tax=Rhodofomes roseus TaxID=34475 RepID=A0A4Y9XYQ7_9APHY|nr:hypothetical protein EVJ58_g8782 [Rhodofomes roseus]
MITALELASASYSHTSPSAYSDLHSQSAVSVALPTIVQELHGSTFIWIGSAYTLAGTAFIPLGGGLAQIFGRRIVILASLAIMSLGSALCGSAKNMTYLIAGRTAVQGLGGGGISATTAIIISDLVPLRERGLFNGLIGIAWAMSSGIGPIVGGALAQSGQWRWLFYLNLPICGIAAVIMIVCLRVKTPPGTLGEKVRRVDWRGTLLIIAATTACVIGLTWSGIQYSWGSAAVLVPLILGLAGIVGFMTFESIVPDYPLVPRTLISTVTGVSGYMQTFVMPILMIGIIYYIPVYLQACKGASAIRSGVDVLSFSLVLAPVGLSGGAFTNSTGRYRPPMWLAWAALMLGIVHVSQNGLALAFFMFLRNFAMVWGVTIGGTVLQNELQKHLPSSFAAQFPEGSAIAYATIPIISQLPEPLKTEVRTAFASSLKVVWEVLLGIAGLGLLSSLFMKGLPLHSTVDDEWGLEQESVTNREAT